MSRLPDLIVTAIALAATLIALAPLNLARRRSVVAARMFALIAGLAALLAARLLAWSGNAVAVVPLLLVASWLPLLALLVAEQLVRRHAPRWMKLLVLAGGMGFTIVSLIAGALWPAPVLLTLAGYQTVAILCAVGLIVRSRHDVSPAEAQLAGVFAAALLLAIPLTATDFQAILALPVRGGAFAALLLVLATSRFVAGTASGRSLAIDVILLVATGAILAGGAYAIWPTASAGELAQIGAIGAATAALALLLQRRGEARLIVRARPSLVTAIAALPDRPKIDELLSAHPLLASGRLVEADMLAAYPFEAVDMLAAERVSTRASGDAARDLLDGYAGTHLVRVSRSPLLLLAVSGGGLAGDSLTAELDLVARVAEAS